MAEINFPASPSEGDEYANYVYNSASGWNKMPPPSLLDLENFSGSGTPVDNSLIQYTSASGWKAAPGLYFPIGGISVFAGSTAPSGFLICNGQVVDKATYPKLFSIIGSIYNTGSESSTQFRLPDLLSRVAVGKSDISSNFNRMGKNGGTRTHTLTVAEMTEHTHRQDEHTHTQNSHAHTQDSHNHGMTISWQPSGWEAANFGLGFFTTYRNICAVTGGWDIGTSGVAPAIQGNTATNNATTATNQAAGGGLEHNNIQPYLVTNYIIRYE